jgi:hypothetical protein
MQKTKDSFDLDIRVNTVPSPARHQFYGYIIMSRDMFYYENGFSAFTA